MRVLLRRWRELRTLGRHERWRVAMGCPGVTVATPREYLDGITPRRGEVYCRCWRCHDAREALGWEPLPGAPTRPRPIRPNPMRGETTG